MGERERKTEKREGSINMTLTPPLLFHFLPGKRNQRKKNCINSEVVGKNLFLKFPLR